MNMLLLKPAEQEMFCDVAKPFSVVVAYDDSLANRKAMEIYSRLLEQFGNDFDFDCGCWSFEQLRPTYMAQEAASVAAHADMVIIGSANGEVLPGHVKLWIEMWLAAKDDHETALVAMIGVKNMQEKAATPAHIYLEQVARQADLSYFASQFQLPRPIPAATIEAILVRAETVTPLLEEILRRPRPPSHWGINE